MQQLYSRKIILAALSLAVLSGTGMLFLMEKAPSIPLFSSRRPPLKEEKEERIHFSFPIEKKVPTLSFPKVQGDLSFSLPKPRPESDLPESLLFIYLKKNSLTKKTELPSRIDLAFDSKGCLSFLEEKSPFWMELSFVQSDFQKWVSSRERRIEVRLFLQLEGQEEAALIEQFSDLVKETPIHPPFDFKESSPFRVLSEARWWGYDLLKKETDKSEIQRLEVSGFPYFLERDSQHWLEWVDGKWEKVLAPGVKGAPIARIEKIEGNQLFLEGWDLDRHIRLCLLLVQPSPLKVKAEDFLSSIRVRSEKQISCMLEKQWLILRVGDWVIKNDDRWKILRKKEDKEAFFAGKPCGELFIFDKIEAKHGQKFIIGSLYNAARSEKIPIEIPAAVQRKGKEKEGKKVSQKGKSR